MTKMTNPDKRPGEKMANDYRDDPHLDVCNEIETFLFL